MKPLFRLPSGMSRAGRATPRLAMALSLLVLVACTQSPPLAGEDPAVLQPKPPATPVVVAAPPVKEPVAGGAAIPPVDGKATSVGSPSGAVAPARAQPSPVQIATLPSVTPVGMTRYECVKGAVGAESRRPITFPENSGRICARFPAMGPCQYERVACRASGGRVIRFDGVEITKEVETEYDKQVQRFRLNAG